ncbi:unnamed protein product [Leptidea sinapis]|uniref:Uncharacterized protein n=1 Tax=Leptidea sinapis TaxID=189913 RepID=A0A5E4QHM2_9NEOP|nr:unnamed protein product [Leptidea sinapis]
MLSWGSDGLNSSVHVDDVRVPPASTISLANTSCAILAILFVLSQYVELWFIRSNLEMAMRNNGITTMQRIWIAEYLLALIAQLFLYCWHSNTVMFSSLTVDEGVYASGGLKECQFVVVLLYLVHN